MPSFFSFAGVRIARLRTLGRWTLLSQRTFARSSDPNSYVTSKLGGIRSPAAGSLHMSHTTGIDSLLSIQEDS